MESTVLPQKRPRPHSNLLSFESDPDDEEPALVKRPLGKNPDVCTEFLPDPSAEEEKRIERERLCQIYEAEQTKVKSQLLQVYFAYWDGTSNRFSLTLPKSISVEEFLVRAIEVLQKHSPDLKTASTASLMCVKDNVILPHDMTFYDFLIHNACGSKGLLFKLSEEEEVWKDSGLMIKILQRKWYDKNKHIFPANKWEIYDPLKHSS